MNAEYSNNHLFNHLKNMFDETYISSEDVKNIVEKYKEKGDVIKWNKEHEQILVGIAEKCNVYTWYHRISSDYLRRRDSVFIYSLIGLNSATSLCTLMGSNYDDIVEPQHLIMLSGSVNFLTGLVTAIYKKVNIGASVDSHMFASKMFRKLSNDISQQLALQNDEREQMPKYLQKCCLEYETLILESPVIPEYIINARYSRDMLRGHEDINVPIEISGGFRKVHVYGDIESLVSSKSDTDEGSLPETIESLTDDEELISKPIAGKPIADVDLSEVDLSEDDLSEDKTSKSIIIQKHYRGHIARKSVKDASDNTNNGHP